MLDIGAWDGGYSFMAERGGAKRVVALDHYAWGVDIEARGEYWDQCAADGTLPTSPATSPISGRPDLPGRRGFEFAAAALESKVETVADRLRHHRSRPSSVSSTCVLYLGVLVPHEGAAHLPRAGPFGDQ